MLYTCKIDSDDKNTTTLSANCFNMCEISFAKLSNGKEKKSSNNYYCSCKKNLIYKLSLKCKGKKKKGWIEFWEPTTEGSSCKDGPEK